MVTRKCPNCGSVWYSADTLSEYWDCQKCGTQIPRSHEEDIERKGSKPKNKSINKEKYHRLLNLRKSEESMFHMLLSIYCHQSNRLLTPRELIEQLPINEKRAHYLLGKFKDYNWGVSLDMGWIE